MTPQQALAIIVFIANRAPVNAAEQAGAQVAIETLQKLIDAQQPKT